MEIISNYKSETGFAFEANGCVIISRDEHDPQSGRVSAVNKEQFTEAYATISRIEDLLSEAGELFARLPPPIQQAIHTYHNERGSLQYCLRWGLQAVTELRREWHAVVADIPCGEPEVAV